MAGFLDGQSGANQTESLYIAYFGRAGDGPGYLYWTGNLASMEAAGTPASVAVVNAANAFAVQPEAKAEFSFLASPPPHLSTTDPVQIAGVDTFINEVYQNLFNRAADSAGLNYWQTQILSGVVSVGSAVYAIANGALGGDQAIVADKIVAASSFTSQTFAANIVSGESFLAAASASVATVVDATTLAASQAATTAFVAGSATSAGLTLTTGQDSIDTAAAGAVFNAPLFSNTLTGGGIIVGGSNQNLQTLTTGDSLIDTNAAGDGTLNAFLNGVGNPAFVSSVTMKGIATANLTTTVVAGGGFQGSITGLTTVNDNNSLGGITLGSTGAGLNTVLTHLNLSGVSIAPPPLTANTPVFAALIAGAALKGTTDTINIGITGSLGSSKAFPDLITLSTDGAAGTIATPSNGYESWIIAAGSGTDFLVLSQNGIGTANNITLTGAGNVTLISDGLTSGVGNWSNLKTIDLTGSGGNVTLTGPTTTGLTAGTDAGLLDNAVLTSFKGGTGTDSVDLSSMTAAQLVAMTSLVGAASGSTLLDTLIVSAPVATGTTAISNMSGFAILGVAAGAAGTLNQANFPGVAQITAEGPLGALMITNGSSPLTLNLGTFASGLATLFQGGISPTTIGNGTSDVLNVTIGSNTSLAGGTVAGLTTFGYETINITTNGGALIHDGLGTIMATPSAGGNEVVTITGNAGFVDTGFINLIPPGAPATVHTTITDMDTGLLTMGGAVAETIDASGGGTSVTGGLVMTFHDGFFSGLPLVATGGATITGSPSAGNVLLGWLGNDHITGGSVTDTIATGGGADTINLGATHSADHVALYDGTGGLHLGGAISISAPSTIVDGADHAQPGFWGVPANAPAALISTLLPVTAPQNSNGTNLDQSVVSHFQVGTAPTADVLDFSVSGWGHGVSLGLVGGDLATPVLGSPTGIAATIQTVSLGNTVAAGTNLIEITGSNFSDATQLALELHTGAGLTFAAALAAAADHAHVLVAYTDGSNTHVADVDLTGAVSASTTAATMEIRASDMVELAGVSSVTSLVSANLHFVA